MSKEIESAYKMSIASKLDLISKYLEDVRMYKELLIDIDESLENIVGILINDIDK